MRGYRVNNHKQRKKQDFWKDVTKMAAPKELLEDMDFAQGQLMASDLSPEFKKRYNTLFNVTKEATNGITPEEKIQKMTESIALLATAQIGYMIEIQNKITTQITKANNEKCLECQAMKHAIKVDQKEKERQMVKGYLEGLGIDTKKLEKLKKDKKGNSCGEGETITEKPEDQSWNETLKAMLLKPYIYVVFVIMAISPYSVEIIRTIGSFFK